MATRQLSPVLRYLRQVRDGGDGTGDGELLERFGSGDAEAFAALVRRHGPMVLGVCRRVLAHAHDADDAFQATFLLLVRKANTLRQPEHLGPWLYGVARRTALKAKALAEVRRRREAPLDDEPAARPSDDLAWRDLRPVLDDAIARLPAKYRVPFVLCHLEGLTNAEAARRLGCPPGTVATRLARAREQLRTRLTRRGVTLSAAVLTAAVPSALSAATVRLLSPAAGAVSVPVATLTEGVCQAMFLTKLRWVVLTLAALVAAGAGGGTLVYRSAAAEPGDEPEKARAAAPRAKEAVKEVNFVVEAPTPAIAELVAREAERQRKASALLWLGKEMPAWEQPCPVNVTIAMQGNAGATMFTFAGGKVLSMSMHLEGALDAVLLNVLPHEVTHTVLAHHFGAPPPRWADEGASVLSEGGQEQERHDKLVRTILAAPGRAIPLRRLLPAHDFPKDVTAFYAEGYSLTRFLVGRKDRKTFLAFVKTGIDGRWDEAVKTHYGYKNVEELEAAWLLSLGVKGGEKVRWAEPSERAREERSLPDGLPPFLARAVMEQEGVIQLRSRVTTYQQWTFESLEGGDAKTPGKAKAVPGGFVPISVEVSRRLDAKEIRAFDADGKPISRTKLAGLLKTETAVLLSADGKPVDPFFLQVVKKGTVILMPPVETMPPPPTLPVPPVGTPQR